MKRASPKRTVTSCRRLLLTCSALGLLPGCLVIPVDHYAAGSRHNLNAGVQSKLLPGVTTKEEVLLLLGEPDHVSDEGQCLWYAWSKVKLIVQFLDKGAEVQEFSLLRITFDANNCVSQMSLREARGERMPPEWSLLWQ